jgi:hypothetical protein
VFVVIVRRQTALFTLTMAAGACAWLVGSLLWLNGQPIYRVAPWWMGFLVLTIAGERLELSRLLRPSGVSRALFAAIAALFACGLVLRSADPDLGARITGAALLLLPVWLVRYDVVRRTVHQAGLPRFIAVSVLSGYVWLVAGGALWLRYGNLVGGLHYDAALHTVFIGFVVVMIFAHAPIIIPSVTGRMVPYRRFFYGHLALLHASLVLRIAGDLAASTALRQAGGVLNEAALLLFLVATIVAVRMGSPRPLPREART